MIDRNWLKWLIAGLILYVSLMLVNLPAFWVVSVVDKTKLPVTFSDTEGTIWNGSANIAMHVPATAGAESGRIRWRINPIYLITGRIGVKLEFVSKEIVVSAEGKASIGKIVIDNLDARLPVSTAAMFYPIASNAGLSGIIHASSDSLSVTKTSIAGSATIDIDSLASTLLGSANNGSYRIDVVAEEKVVRYTVTTRSGIIQLSGAGDWEPFSTGRLVFDGNISGNQGAPLPTWLQELGKANGGDGSIHLLWNIQLPYFTKSAELP